jgi:hypothetical protein
LVAASIVIPTIERTVAHTKPGLSPRDTNCERPVRMVL